MPPAGWYADPLAVADLRWWSGTDWTESTHNVVEGPDPEPGSVQEPPMQEPEPKPVRGDWEMRKPFKVMVVIILALIALSAVGGVLAAVGVIEEDNDQSAAPAASDANVDFVASKSYCTATGVDDLYTGDGHVQFLLTLTNNGGEPKTVAITPVRHYDDGQLNQSSLDAVEVEVAAGETWSGRTPAYKYKAHEHELIACGVIVDGGEEITIEALRL
jgi:uncharacterized protein DUF2510